MIITSNQQLRQALKEQNPKVNPLALPVISSVVVNIGVGKIKDDEPALNKTKTLLSAITGQKPIIAKARKSIAAFKVREGVGIGLKVTLRGQRAYDFLNKLMHFSLPRIRDFRGLDQGAINGRSFNLGVKESDVLPEISLNQEQTNFGFGVTVIFSGKQTELIPQALELIGVKFKKTDV